MSHVAAPCSIYSDKDCPNFPPSPVVIVSKPHASLFYTSFGLLSVLVSLALLMLISCQNLNASLFYASVKLSFPLSWKVKRNDQNQMQYVYRYYFFIPPTNLISRVGYFLLNKGRILHLFVISLSVVLFPFYSTKRKFSLCFPQTLFDDMAELPDHILNGSISGDDSVVLDICDVTDVSCNASTSSASGSRVPRIPSGEDSVEYEVPVRGHNGDTSNSSVPVDRNASKSDVPEQASNASKSGSSAPEPRKLVKRMENHHLAMLMAKLFDERLSVRKQLKLFRRLATVKDDGTVRFEVPGDVKPPSLNFGAGVVCGDIDEEHLGIPTVKTLPPLQIVMLIVGTRGDVQPFVAIGKRFQEDGHRVRLATHSNFRDFVLTAGLEFFPLGGDPKVLAGYMVKNKGFLPSTPSEIYIQRNQMKEIIFSLLPACQAPDPETKVSFKADAIIANPPAYGHTHVAEALKVPLHIFFTMPWTPTSEFPHPLSRVKQSVGYKLSYQIVDGLIWLGIRDMINEFRKKKLKLRPVTYLSGYYSSPSDLPYGYIWSPHLVPKPKDWGPKIDVVGFCFLDLASNYKPPEELVNWLENGNAPIYVGFGSLPVQEPEKMTQTIFQALEMTGQRGIINKGWGGLGDLAETKDFVYLLDNCPHDWLFLRCKAVVHHGGAGTTAAGLKAACPTTIVPFFGDQPFWGEQVHAKGVGPAPIPVEEFSLEKLVDAITYMLDPQVKIRAVELAKAMEKENGVTGAVNAFYKQFPERKPESEYQPLPTHHRFSIRRCFGSHP